MGASVSETCAAPYTEYGGKLFSKKPRCLRGLRLSPRRRGDLPFSGVLPAPSDNLFRRFGTSNRSQLQLSRSPRLGLLHPCRLKMGPICSTETSVRNYHPTCLISQKSAEHTVPVYQIVRCYYYYYYCCGPGSIVGITTSYGLDDPEIESRWGRIFPHLSRPTLGPTQPPVQ